MVEVLTCFLPFSYYLLEGAAYLVRAMAALDLIEATLFDRTTWALKVHKASALVTARKVLSPCYAHLRPEPRSGGPDEARSRSEGDRRARKKVIMLCAENKLNRLITLTTALPIGTNERDKLLRHIGRFGRNLRTAIPGIRYLWVVEVHPRRGSLHVHLGVDRWISKETIARCWKIGFVDVRRISPVKKGDARKSTGQYLAKYVGKSFATGCREKHSRRFSVSQNLKITIVEFETFCLAGAVKQSSLIVGRSLYVVWCSWDKEDWRGPPTVLIGDPPL